MEAPQQHVPNGHYCYTRAPERDADGSFGVETCPFWDLNLEYPHRENGYCRLLEVGDWEDGIGVVWDQIKECDINVEFESEAIPDT